MGLFKHVHQYKITEVTRPWNLDENIGAWKCQDCEIETENSCMEPGNHRWFRVKEWSPSKMYTFEERVCKCGDTRYSNNNEKRDPTEEEMLMYTTFKWEYKNW